MRFITIAAAAVLSIKVTAAFAPPLSTARTTLLPSSVMVLKVAGKEQQEVDGSSMEQEEIDGGGMSTEEEDFLQQCKILCDERNLSLEQVKNARDLASAAHSPVLPNRVYRMGRVSDATPEDIELLFKEIDFKTLVDLRSPTELKDDPTLERQEVFKDFTSLVWSERGRGKDGCLRELQQDESPIHKKHFHWFGNRQVITEEEECDVCAEGSVPASEVFVPHRKERHFVSLMNEFKYVKGTLSKLRKRDIARTVLKSPGALVSRRVRSNIKKPFLDEINDGGLPMLNELLLRFGAPGIKYVLELVADKSRHPIGFYCTAGKDRTGMIAALILALCGVPDEDIVEDYTLSANVYAEMNDHKAMVGALSQRNLDPKTFLCAPPQVMRDTLEAIREDYGSVEEYCDWIGFGPEQQKKLRDALMKE